MALTPRGIFSPDSTDGYDVTVDWAATADSIESALVQAANSGVGTTVQRTAALAGFPNGAIWYDTTLSAEYRKVAGVWVATQAPYVSATAMIAGGLGSSGATPVEIRGEGGRTRLRGAITGLSLAASGTLLVMTLTAPYRPLVPKYFTLLSQSESISGDVVISTAGVVTVRNASYSAGSVSAVRLDNIEFDRV